MMRRRKVWDSFTLYLPVVVMGLLALASWWLVRSAPSAQPVAPAKAPTHEADYFMKDFAVQSFDAKGHMTSLLQGRMAHHYPDTDTLEIDSVQMQSTAPNGRRTMVVAKRGLSNSDGSEVQLFGNARVTREAMLLPNGKRSPELRFESEFLHAWTNEERVFSNKPVVLWRGADRFTADRLHYDHLEQVLQLDGRVRGVLQSGSAKAGE
jgi:lipopolysaccharide export system protein LptC